MNVYILYSKTKEKYYIGFRGDGMASRLRKHNSNNKGFTGGSGDWVVVHIENFVIKSSALKKEKEIKGWKSRQKIIALIAAK
jgi:putative endonuclease